MIKSMQVPFKVSDLKNKEDNFMFLAEGQRNLTPGPVHLKQPVEGTRIVQQLSHCSALPTAQAEQQTGVMAV